MRRARLEPVAPERRWTVLPAEWLRHQQALVEAATRWTVGSPAGGEAIARMVTSQLLRALWLLATGSRWRGQPTWPTPDMEVDSVELRRTVQAAAEALHACSPVEAAYCVGLLYTDLLPATTRSARGAYYTPPVLADRLLDMAAGEGVDWSTASVLDPACGGGAFLVPVALRMLGHHRIQVLSAEERLIHLETHLAGIEIDPFAAWMTRVFLELVTEPLAREAGRRLQVKIETADALDVVLDDGRRFDLVVGNPPFGRVALSVAQRATFARSLYGHANLYGVFLDAALRWRASSGLVAYVVPTSFLGGQYFSRLRALLLEEAPPLVLDVVEDRTGVFPSVQQETCLAVFGPNPTAVTTVHVVAPRGTGLDVEHAGSFPLRRSAEHDSPWLLPRTDLQAQVAVAGARLRMRLEALGYRASTGPLVWNRVKGQLRAKQVTGAYPLIWAEAVRPNAFSFDYRARADRSFVVVPDGQEYLLINRPCVLVQRTTAKEQHRRLVACAVPEEFLARWGAVVVENHVNVLWAPVRARVSPRALAAVLNTAAVDVVFRCLSGSVAVSASELHALPLPPLETFARVEQLCRDLEQPHPAVEDLVAEVYGIERIAALA